MSRRRASEGGPRPPRSRARVDTSTIEKERRVRVIVEMMLSRAWTRGKSAGPLATEWGCSKKTVEHYSAEASRYVRQIVDPEWGRRVCADALVDGLARARKHDAPREIAAVVNAYAPILGIQRDRLELSGPAGGPIESEETLRVVVLPPESKE